ncbi:Galactosyl transferase GMA12/MNN10 family protein [Actinidia rufa]|uniref:Galactosyl transferase GMA12/MNN10 family protein n=1 Tax=Actinidia rufa TaxID=165716 RepID=A0A7J0EJJ8_9ERIC|nr:Galactosyl transferase GMA12/MNN10 family protein [Actinidia rufa]
MAKTIVQTKPIFIGGATVALLMVWTLWPWPRPLFPTMFQVTKSKFTPATQNCTTDPHGVNLCHDDPLNPTFYDDPNLSYSIEIPIKDWDVKRRDWLEHHPSYAAGAGDRVVVLSGSQPWPCKNPIGDHLLLRLFKNKVDYCRINGYDLFYNNAMLHPKMASYWAKIPIVRAAMVAHPEAEWIFWVDSDAVFTDMDFKPPLERYKNHNLVVDGWPNLIYEKKSWIGVNAGVFLIRNCQWSMDFLEVWAGMGPQTPNYEKWGQILTSTLKDKMYSVSDDQSALVYLLLNGKYKWRKKIYIENKYTLSGYWAGIVDSLTKMEESYLRRAKGARELRRPHAEVVREYYAAAMRETIVKEGDGGGALRPFITHFTGCQPCSGNHPGYTDEACWNGIEKAINFADNQVLRNYGFARPDLLNSSSLSPLSFDFPS